MRFGLRFLCGSLWDVFGVFFVVWFVLFYFSSLSFFPSSRRFPSATGLPGARRLWHPGAVGVGGAPAALCPVPSRPVPRPPPREADTAGSAPAGEGARRREAPRPADAARPARRPLRLPLRPSPGGREGCPARPLLCRPSLYRYRYPWAAAMPREEAHLPPPPRLLAFLP